MSFVAPTTNVIAITSGAQIIASGTVAITLNVRNAPNFTSSNFTMDVTDLGSIEIDFNYIEDIGDVNEFTINVPRLEFEILDSIKDSTGSSDESFIDLLTSLDASDLIVAKIDINGKSDYYYTTREQCEFSFIDRKVKLQAQHPLKYGAIGFGKNWSASNFTGKFVDYIKIAGGPQPAVDAILPRELIEIFLDTISENSELKYFSSLHLEKAADLKTDGELDFILVDGVANDITSDFAKSSEIVKSIALSECAIIGNVLGYAFYVPRFSKSILAKSTLSSDDFSELELDISFKNVRLYSQTLRYTTSGEDSQRGPEIVVTDQSINELGRNDVNVTYGYIDKMIPAEFNTTSDAYEFDINGVDINLPAGFEDDVIEAYKKVFRISDSVNNVDAGSYISGTILGIDKLKPYEYFSVGSGVHPLVDNKDFRPSYLKYNLLDDTIEFEAYEF